MSIKEITIQSHFLLVGGYFIDLGKVWRGFIDDRLIQLYFIGAGKVEFYRDDDEDVPVTESAIILHSHLFDQLRAYLKVNLKPIEIA